ncbi:hypothetical protein F5Y12DRAFT_709144 [Xylaria sp. FL1777]|nr:hypothetical protein F5Y12DRAFT_709144 [Xylaria sp. FL1777]
MLPKPLFLTTLLLAVTEGLSSREHTPDDLPRNSHISDIAWTGRVEEDGDMMSLTGSSLQHIEAQIRETKLDFVWPRATEPGAVTSSFSFSSPSILAGRDILCDINWNPPFASVFHIRQGISYLHKIRGDCSVGPGPGNCTRVSCSYGSGIWFCNDNPHPMSVPCSTFGDRAWDIVEKCYAFGDRPSSSDPNTEICSSSTDQSFVTNVIDSRFIADFPTDSVQGQVFDTAGWNVIVGGAKC